VKSVYDHIEQLRLLGKVYFIDYGAFFHYDDVYFQPRGEDCTHPYAKAGPHMRMMLRPGAKPYQEPAPTVEPV